MSDTNVNVIANPFITINIMTHGLAASIVVACREYARKQLDECRNNFLAKLPETPEQKERWHVYNQQALRLIGWADELSLSIQKKEEEDPNY